MKSFKKALAVLLSVLMIVFSFPVSALALVNENNPDGYYSEDYDVEVLMYAFQYTGPNAWGYDIDYTSLHQISEEDMRHFSKDDLEGKGATKGTFAIAIVIKGADAIDSTTMAFAMDTSKVINASYLNPNVVRTGSAAATTSVLAANYFYDDEGLGSDYSNGYWDMQSANPIQHPGPGDATTSLLSCYVAAGAKIDPTTDLSYGGDPENATIDGSVMTVYGMQLVKPDEEINLFEAIVPYMTTTSQQLSPDGTRPHYIYAYDATWSTDDYDTAFQKVQDSTDFTLYTLPQWGITGPTEEPTDVTYTYTFANGESEQVKAAAGVAPVAPENTANTAATSNNDGTHTYTTYSWPEWVEGTKEYTEVATPVTDSCNMEEIEAAVDPIHSDGQLVDGKTAVMQCTDCGYKTGGEVIPAGEHDYQLSEELSTPATCVAEGENVYVCSVCGDTMTEATEIDPNNHANVVTDPEVPATCTTTGLTEGSHCEACSVTIVEQEEIPALGHDFSVQAGESDATCITPGTTTWKCSRCEETEVRAGEVNPNNHEGDVALDPETVKEATRGEDGYTGDTVCSACHQVVTKGEVIPALGVMITVEQNELGATTLNGEATTGEAQKVAYKDSYTLTATANEGAEFVGWQVNGKLVSTNATYTTAAYADLTYVPVFAEKTDDFTVTFVDQFNMVLGTYTSSQIAELEAMPNTHTYLGYTFANWSMTLEEVKALETNAIVTASYTKDDALTYTVSAPGCVITVGSETYNDTAEVGFDKAVTVAPAEGTATAWTVNGNNAAYGAEYTFYVTSDVEVAYTSDEVTAAPTVAGVDVTAVGDGSVRFLATRNVPEGYTLLESGYVYGKDFEDAEASLVLENANSTCYIYKNSNTAGDGQFALTFKIAAQTGVAYARAYIIVNDSEGKASTYYAGVQSYDYDA